MQLAGWRLKFRGVNNFLPFVANSVSQGCLLLFAPGEMEAQKAAGFSILWLISSVATVVILNPVELTSNFLYTRKQKISNLLYKFLLRSSTLLIICTLVYWLILNPVGFEFFHFINAVIVLKLSGDLGLIRGYFAAQGKWNKFNNGLFLESISRSFFILTGIMFNSNFFILGVSLPVFIHFIFLKFSTKSKSVGNLNLDSDAREQVSNLRTLIYSNGIVQLILSGPIFIWSLQPFSKSNPLLLTFLILLFSIARSPLILAGPIYPRSLQILIKLRSGLVQDNAPFILIFKFTLFIGLGLPLFIFIIHPYIFFMLSSPYFELNSIMFFLIFSQAFLIFITVIFFQYFLVFKLYKLIFLTGIIGAIISIGTASLKELQPSMGIIGMSLGFVAIIFLSFFYLILYSPEKINGVYPENL